MGDGEKDVPLGQVDIGLLADQVGVTTADTLDTGQGVHNLLLAIDVGVKQTQNELEVRLLAGHERCRIHTFTGQPFFPFSICANITRLVDSSTLSLMRIPIYEISSMKSKATYQEGLMGTYT